MDDADPHIVLGLVGDPGVRCCSKRVGTSSSDFHCGCRGR